MAISAKELPKNHTDKERFAAASSCIATEILTLLFARKRRRSTGPVLYQPPRSRSRRVPDLKVPNMASKGNSVFSRIIRRELPATFLHEDDQCIAIEDINPQAPVHFLVIPKKEIRKITDATDEDEQLLGHCMIVAKKVAAQKGIDQEGYRVVINNGQHGCQSVYHIHLHVLGGRKLKFPPG